MKKKFVSCDAGLINQDYQGAVMVFITNNGSFSFFVNVGDRTAQIVFHEKEIVVLKKVDKLSCTARRSGGFDSTGV